MTWTVVLNKRRELPIMATAVLSDVMVGGVEAEAAVQAPALPVPSPPKHVTSDVIVDANLTVETQLAPGLTHLALAIHDITTHYI